MSESGSLTSAGGTLIDYVGRLCKSAIGGRRAARVLAGWARQFNLGEAEFQVLWRLRSAPTDGRDQRALASELAVSTAQVSAIVERLRLRGVIEQRAAPGDRRRNLWQLSGNGRELIDQMLAAAVALDGFASHDDRGSGLGDAREAAA